MSRSCVTCDAVCTNEIFSACMYHGEKYSKWQFKDCTHPKRQCGEEFTKHCAACRYNTNNVHDPIPHNVDVVQDIKPISYFDTQVAGDHYNNKYDVAKFCIGNNYGCAESAIIKYAARHERKNGAEDIKKIIHYAQFILEEKYGIRPTK